MNQLSEIRFERTELQRAISSLSALDFRVLIELAIRAHPATGRLWQTKGRLAEDFTMSDAFLEQLLEHLASENFIEESDSVGVRLGWIELGEVFIRQRATPDNLPVERAT